MIWKPFIGRIMELRGNVLWQQTRTIGNNRRAELCQGAPISASHLVVQKWPWALKVSKETQPYIKRDSEYLLPKIMHQKRKYAPLTFRCLCFSNINKDRHSGERWKWGNFQHRNLRQKRKLLPNQKYRTTSWKGQNWCVCQTISPWQLFTEGDHFLNYAAAVLDAKKLRQKRANCDIC